MENLFYKWKQLGEGVFHIQDLFSDYMYLVAGEEKAALIDTGMGFPGLRQLVSENPEKLENNVSSVKVRKKPELMALPAQINLGGRVLEVFHTPGHTKGSVCFYDRKNEILFSGDTVCSMGVMLNFPESVPVEEFMQSIDFLREKTGKCEQIYPGHHKVPLDDSYFQKYLDCGELVLTHPEQGYET